MTPSSSNPSSRPSSNDVAEVAHRLRLATARLARLLRQQAGTGLSPSQHSVLASIDGKGSLTLGELAAIEQVAPPTITKIVSKLEDDGLVLRTVDDRDRRVARVSISPVGRARLDQSRSRRDAWLTRRLEQADPADIARLADALDVLEALAEAPPPADAPPTAKGPSAPGTATEEPSPPTVTR
jgi:DNA-binding MarR family transcriptional regulator